MSLSSTATSKVGVLKPIKINGGISIVYFFSSIC